MLWLTSGLNFCFQTMLTKEQKYLLAHLVRENKDVLLKKFGSPGVTKKKKEQIWEYIRHELMGKDSSLNEIKQTSLSF